jgi:hypothetical protein
MQSDHWFHSKNSVESRDNQGGFTLGVTDFSVEFPMIVSFRTYLKPTYH